MKNRRKVLLALAAAGSFYHSVAFAQLQNDHLPPNCRYVSASNVRYGQRMFNAICKSSVCVCSAEACTLSTGIKGQLHQFYSKANCQKMPE